MDALVALLALGMLLCGTVNTISTKYQVPTSILFFRATLFLHTDTQCCLQDMVVVRTDEGNPVFFRHPLVQSFLMFFGESLCLIPYYFLRWRCGRRSGTADTAIWQFRPYHDD